MRLLITLTTLLLLSSCGNGKLRFKRVSPFKQQKIIEIKNDRDLTRNQTSGDKEKTYASQFEKNKPFIEAIEEDEPRKPEAQQDIQTVVTEFPPIVSSDTLETATSEEQEIAKKAEDLSTVAVWSNRFAIIILLLSGATALFMSNGAALLIGSIIGFLLGITAIVLGFLSKSRSYNTKLGSKQSSKAIVVGFIVTLIMGFVILLSADTF